MHTPKNIVKVQYLDKKNLHEKKWGVGDRLEPTAMFSTIDYSGADKKTNKNMSEKKTCSTTASGHT